MQEEKLTNLPPIHGLLKKIQIARKQMQALGLKKVTDEFSGSSRFDNALVINHALSILSQLNIFTLVSVDQNLAVLKSIDLDTFCDVQITLPLEQPIKPEAQEQMRANLYTVLLELH